MSKRYAILFSSEDYLNAAKTPFCHADRELMARVLTESCDYAVGDVISVGLTKNDDDQVTLVMNHLMATKERIRPGDTVLFYYAGHGTSVNDEPYLILPCTDPDNLEKTAIAIRDVSDQLREEGVQCFRVFDSCHSGFDVRNGEMAAEPLMRGVIRRSPDGWVTLAGCAPDEVCYSSTEEGHGVFTSRLARAIGEVEEGKDVRPESLKVRVCDLVDEWSADSGRSQTPTLIAVVRGNVSLATRRKLIPRKDDVESVAVITQSGAEVRTRLVALQGDAPPKSELYWERFKTIVETLRDLLNANRNIVADYACPLGEVVVERVNDVSESLETGVVDLMYREGWRALHRVHKEVTVEPSPYSAILGGFARRTRHVDRELSQSYDYPHSVVHSSFDSDGALPGLKIIHYVCPLQTRFLLYSKIEVSGVMNEEGRQSHAWYARVNMQDSDAAKRHATFVMGKATEMFRAACETNIQYLEKEQND
jgi:hypothetical protein